MADQYVAAIVGFLHRHGFSTFNFTHRGKHRAVEILRPSGVVTVFFPSTGSDSRRGPRNCVRDLRHALGLVDKAPTCSEPKQRAKMKRQRPVQAHKPVPKLEPDPRPDRYLAPLHLLKEQLTARAAASFESVKVAAAPRRVRLRTPQFGARARFIIADPGWGPA